MEAGTMQSQPPVSSPTAYYNLLPAAAYATPPVVATLTSHGSPGAYSAFHRGPPLLTRHTPPAQCSTDWFVPVGTSRQSSAFSDAAYNSDWSTCQPYGLDVGTYSAGVCPDMSEFQSVTKMHWGGAVSDDFYVGACCGTAYRLSVYQTVSETDTQYACFSTAVDKIVRASVSQDDGVHISTLLQGPVTIVAQPMYMAWHERDVLLHDEKDAQSLRLAMASAGSVGGPQEPTATPTPGPEPDSAAPRLQPGAIAGIAVGFAACVIIIAVLGYLAWSRRWKKGEEGSGHHPHPPGPAKTPDPAPVSAAQSRDGRVPPEVDMEMGRIKGPQIHENRLDSPSSSHTGRFRDDYEVEPKTLLLK